MSRGFEVDPSPVRRLGLCQPFYEGILYMPKVVLSALSACLLLASPVCQLCAQGNKPAPPPPQLKVGDTAPDFKLQYFDGTDDKEVTLSQYRAKKNVVLAFYIFAFTGG
jgi:AhpC/TSA family